jgi:hypothetical protein
MTPSRIEPSTFWLVAQCLSELCHVQVAEAGVVAVTVAAAAVVVVVVVVMRSFTRFSNK